MSTSFPEEVKRHVKGRYVLVMKDKYEFLDTEDKDATEEEHSKWFHAFWWIKPKGMIFYDTKAEAIEGGLSFAEKPQNWLYYWIVYNGAGKMIEGGF
jgi:hypothetical protein